MSNSICFSYNYRGGENVSVYTNHKIHTVGLLHLMFLDGFIGRLIRQSNCFPPVKQGLEVRSVPVRNDTHRCN